MADKVQYPVTPETLHKYAKDIFVPIQRGECVTTVWVPMAGRRMWNKFIIENIGLFEKELPDSQKYLLVYVEPLDLTEESLSGYLKLMAKSLIEECEKNDVCKKVVSSDVLEAFSKDDASYGFVLDGLKKLLSQIIKLDNEIIFFIGEFDELTFANKIFYNNLKSLWSGLHPKLHYVFLMRERVTKKENITLWGELNETILQNIVYVPLGSETDINYWIDTFSSAYAFEASVLHKETLKKMCGGHPYLLKVGTKVLSKNLTLSADKLKEELINYYELKSIARGILNVNGETEKEYLSVIVSEKGLKDEKYSDVSNFLEEMGYISVSGNKYIFFSEIFKRAVKFELDANTKPERQNNNNLLDFHLDIDSGELTFKGKTIEEKFTRQEYSVLSNFIKNSEKLLSRDDIGSVLWGKDSYEKYSDWAIDQLISKLRKKINKLGSKDNLTTIRGKGYKFIKWID